MRPSVSQLLSWQPAQLAAAGTSLVARAADLQRSAADLTSIGSGLSGVWSGAAAQAATAHHRRRAAEVDELATVVHTAGQALLRAADAIGPARTSLQSALAAASAAGCTVLDDGTVLPPARPPVPGGLSDQDLTTWQTQADATAAADAAVAARLASQIRAALTAAGAADATSAAALSALQPPQISPAPRPVQMGLTGGQWAPVPLPSCPVTPQAPAPPAPEEEDDGGFWSSLGHGVLDVAGLVPVLGEPADGINAIWYEAEGDHLNAGLSAAGMVPFLGWGATGAKLGIKGVKAADEAAAASRAAGETTQAGRAADGTASTPAPATRQPASFGSAADSDYRGTFFGAHPQLQGQVVVHHAVEQQVLRRYPDLVSESQMHSLENLRGIPNELNNTVHLSAIRKEWNRFYKANPNPTQQDLLDKATEIDGAFGSQFNPPLPD